MRKTNILFIIVALYSTLFTSCNVIIEEMKEYTQEHSSETRNFGTKELVLSGDTVVHKYNVDNFSHINTNTHFSIDVIYKQSNDTPSATLICNKELLPFVEVYDKNGILYIENTDSIHNTYSTYNARKYVCTLVCNSKKLTNIKQSSGNITIETDLKGKRLAVDKSGFGDFICKKPLELDELEITSSGSGNTTLRGTFKNAILDISGFGDINIDGDLTAQDLSIDISGSGDIVFYKPAKIETLKIDLSGFGDIDIDELESTNIDIDCSGSGNSTISKINTQSLNLNISGYGDIDITDLKSTNTKINCNGSGNIKIPKINNKSLNIKASGYGDVRLDDGFVENLNIDFSGSSSFEAAHLKADNVTFNASGYGKHHIGLINKSMDVQLHNSTSLTYSGNPEIQNIDISGNASIRKRNNNE